MNILQEFKGLTFAKAAKLASQKYSGKKLDLILDELMSMNEKAKTSKPTTDIPKAFLGLDLTDPNTLPAATIAGTGTGLTKQPLNFTAGPNTLTPLTLGLARPDFSAKPTRYEKKMAREYKRQMRKEARQEKRAARKEARQERRDLRKNGPKDYTITDNELTNLADQPLGQMLQGIQEGLPQPQFDAPLVGSNTEGTSIGNPLFDYNLDRTKLRMGSASAGTMADALKESTPALSPLIDAQKETTKEEEEKKDKRNFFKDNVYGPMALGKGLEAAGKIFMLSQGYDRYDPIKNPYSEQIKQQMAGLTTRLDAARNDALAQQAAAFEGTENIRSTAVKQAADQNILASGTEQLSKISAAETEARNKASMQYAQTLDVLGQQDVRAEETARQLTAESKAGFQESILNLLESVGATGEEISKAKAGMLTETMVAQLMSTGNFYVDPNCKPQSGYFSSDCIQPIKSRVAESSDGGVARTELNT